MTDRGAGVGRLLNSRWFRGVLYQGLVVGGVGALLAFLVANTLHNLAARGIATGFGFLSHEAGFDIGESLIPVNAADSYGRAILAGTLNTALVSAVGIVLATAVGVMAGIARLSSNWLLARIASLYVEAVRNVPLLLQLLVWYGVVLILPPPRQALRTVGGVFLSNRGLKLPLPVGDPVHAPMLAALVAGVVAAWALARWAKRRREATGRPFPTAAAVCALVILPPLIPFLLAGAPLAWDVPRLTGFNFVGGLTLSPEFTALVAGLALYTGGFIAEVVRSGIQAVPVGQTEAALSLGLRPGQVLRLVILPQALRVIVPPLASQYLNLTKNSSLAVAIGYPELVSVTNTAANQTGQVVESTTLMMAGFLVISLVIAMLMNWYNQKVVFKTR